MAIKNILVNKRRKEYAEGILNRRANEKLNIVINSYTKALKGYCKTEYDGFMFKRISFHNLYYLRELKLSYNLKDRLFARSYDLIIEYEIPAVYDEKMEFKLRYLGNMNINGAEFEIVNGDQEANFIFKKLNNPLIIDRLVKLDLLDLIIDYSIQNKKWNIRVDSLIGSTTWNLIPPALQVITPTEKECIFMIELFELIADALRNDL